MHIYRCCVAHHRFDGHEVLVHPVEITRLVPDIAIHLFLKVTQVSVVKFRFSCCCVFCFLRISAEIHLFGIVGPAGKGRVDIHKVYLDTIGFEVGTGRHAVTTQQQIVPVVVAHHLLTVDLVERHTALYALIDGILVLIGKYALCTHEIV